MDHYVRAYVCMYLLRTHARMYIDTYARAHMHVCVQQRNVLGTFQFALEIHDSYSWFPLYGYMLQVRKHYTVLKWRNKSMFLITYNIKRLILTYKHKPPFHQQ